MSTESDQGPRNDDDLAWHYSAERCGARAGWSCTRRAGHDGPHIAVANDWDDVCAVWTDDAPLWELSEQDLTAR